MKRISSRNLFILCLLALVACLGWRTCYAAPKPVKLDRAMQRKLNTFFSNFSEARIQPFKRGGISDAQLIRFAMAHEVINRKGAYNAPISAARAEQLAMYYFGRKLTKHHSTEGHTYSNGRYRHGIYEGDPLPFAQVTKLVDVGKGEFAAYTREYATHDELDHHASPAEWKRRGQLQGMTWFTGTRRGTVKQVGSGARRRFILLDYQVLSTANRRMR